MAVNYWGKKFYNIGPRFLISLKKSDFKIEEIGFFKTSTGGKGLAFDLTLYTDPKCTMMIGQMSLGQMPLGQMYIGQNHYKCHSKCHS
jgi:hypothetical protein